MTDTVCEANSLEPCRTGLRDGTNRAVETVPTSTRSSRSAAARMGCGDSCSSSSRRSVLATIFLSIAAAIAAATEKRVVALGVATFAWFFFVLLYDGAALSLAGWLTGSARRPNPLWLRLRQSG